MKNTSEIKKSIDKNLLKLALSTKGFMPEDEGLALYKYFKLSATSKSCCGMEIGAYCGRSTLFLGAAAKESGATLFSLDHHRGSEENQIGWEHHDRELFDPITGKLESLNKWRESITKADLDQSVVGLVGYSEVVAKFWQTSLDFLFIDGGHSRPSAFKDYRNWAKHVKKGGILAIHDVFENPEDGGRPPYEIFLRAKESKAFVEIDSMGSLRFLSRIAQGI